MSTEEPQPDINELLKQLLDECQGLKETEAKLSGEFTNIKPPADDDKAPENQQ